MKVNFYKYQGTGNDFVIVPDTKILEHLTQVKIEKICDRRFGVGADGFIVLDANPQGADVGMIYFNSDGRLSSFCGNGSRCTAHLAHHLGYTDDKFTLKASDGIHAIEMLHNDQVAVTMLVADEVRKISADEYFIDTGSPHLIKMTQGINKIDVNTEGRSIRNRKEFKAEGVNVNFVQRLDPESLSMRTYERGVEAETLSCGTGVTAAAIVNSYLGDFNELEQSVKAVGGELEVVLSEGKYPLSRIILIGPAKKVFEGSLEI